MQCCNVRRGMRPRAVSKPPRDACDPVRAGRDGDANRIRGTPSSGAANTWRIRSRVDIIRRAAADVRILWRRKKAYVRDVGALGWIPWAELCDFFAGLIIGGPYVRDPLAGGTSCRPPGRPRGRAYGKGQGLICHITGGCLAHNLGVS